MVTSEELQDLLAVKAKIFFHDQFFSSDHITTAVTQSALPNISARTMLLNTWLMANSTIEAYYTNKLYNPRYARALIRTRFSSIDDVFAFFGFRDNTTDPTWQMTESHSGFMIYDGKLYAVSGDGDPISPKYQTQVLADVDVTRDLLFEIKNVDFRWYSIPYMTAYFDEMIEPQLEKVHFRKWSPVYQNGSAVPLNQVHYLYFFIKNLTNENQYLEVKSVNYFEEYSD